jgi:hypothetical protein
MANSLYDFGRQSFLEGSIAYLTDDVRVALIGSGYTPDIANHRYYSDIGPNVIMAQSLTTKTSAAGVAYADNLTFTGLAAGTIAYLVLFKSTLVANTSTLICVIDSAVGLPVTVPSGSVVTVTWDTGSNGIFKL